MGMTLERHSRTRAGLSADVLLRPAGDPPPGVVVTLEFEGERLTIGGETIGHLGTWNLADVTAARSEDGVVLVIDEEPLVAVFDDRSLEVLLLGAGRLHKAASMVLPMVAGLLVAATIWVLLF